MLLGVLELVMCNHVNLWFAKKTCYVLVIIW